MSDQRHGVEADDGLQSAQIQDTTTTQEEVIEQLNKDVRDYVSRTLDPDKLYMFNFTDVVSSVGNPLKSIEEQVKVLTKTVKRKLDPNAKQLIFLMASAAIMTVVNDDSCFVPGTLKKVDLVLASGPAKIRIESLGNIIMNVTNRAGEQTEILMKDVGYAPKCKVNMLSIGILAKSHFRVEWGAGPIIVSDQDKELAFAPLEQFWWLPVTISQQGQ